MIVAHSKRRGIGFRGDLPWYLKDDMSRFKRLTIGDGNNAVVMGKKTWLSLSKRPLSARNNLILSQSLSFDFNKSWNKDIPREKWNPNVKVFSEVNTLRKFCEEQKYDDVWVIGGGEIYNKFLQAGGNINSIYTTEIENDYECDVYFPEIPDWFVPHWKSNPKVEKDTTYSYVIYKRRN